MQNKIERFAATLLLLLSAAHGAFAQKGNTDVEPKNLPKGVSAAKAQALSRISKASDGKEFRATNLRRNTQMRKLHSISASARAALKRVLDADKSGKFKSYQTEMERIRKLELNERKKELSRIEAEYLPFFQDAFRQAKIDEADLQRKISGIFPGAKFGPLLTATGTEPDEPESEEPDSRAHAMPATQTFEAPYGLRSVDRSAQGLSLQSITVKADLDTGVIFSDALIDAGLGNGRGVAAVGQAVDVDSGVDRIRATVVTDTSYELYAFSLLINGVAGSWADAAVVLDNPNGVRRKRTRNLGWVIAPVLWFASASGEEKALTLTKLVDVPGSNGGQFQIRARVTAEAYTYGALGIGDAEVVSQLKSITVRDLPFSRQSIP